MTLPLCFCVMSMLLSPALTQAASETSSIAAGQAADQKAALAKKAADRQKAAEEKQKAAQVQETEALGVEAPKEKTGEK
ncbi:MAG: hypothetical protein PHN45_05385 [Methylococcales bacterium]|nr:hypothetical protein [Methylococcales bacterium]